MLTTQEALQKHFGFSEFREGQEAAVQRILNGQHTLLVMPTGAGKSLTYQLPALLLPGVTLVISPLIALMKDQVDSLLRAELPATYINSSLPGQEVHERMRAVLEGHVKLLYIAPERLRNSQFMRLLSKAKVSLLAVDEAHCVSQWGHDFRPDYLRIGPTWQAMGRPTLLATTATATTAVQKHIVKLLGLDQNKIIVAGFNRPNLTFKVEHTPDDQVKLQLLKIFLQKAGGSAIVYTATRRNAEEVADFIRGSVNLPAQAYHAGLDRDLRARVQDDFMGDKLKVVVATNAFGMGVDKANVRAVIHYNIPSSVEAYYQEAGRAGRDNLAAECVLLYSPSDQGLQEWLIRVDTPTAEDLQQVYNLLAHSAREGEAQATVNDLAERGNLPFNKIRIALSDLELAGAILHLNTQGMVNQWKVLPFSGRALAEQAKAIQKRADSRLKLLQGVLDYAQLTTCRRKFLLSYFGDTSNPQSPHCCDNHRAEQIEHMPKATTPQEWYPLIILETANTLPYPVGRNRLADILVGSTSAKVKQFGYDSHKFYGKLSGRLSQTQVVELIDALVQSKYLQLVGGDKPVLQASPLGLEAIKYRAALPIRLQAFTPLPAVVRKKGNTVEETYDLFKQGFSPSEIAATRGLAESTIYNHLTELVKYQKINLNQIVPAEIEERVVEAITMVGDTKALFPIKALLPAEISYEQIRCVVAAHPAPSSNGPQPLPSPDYPISRVIALGRTGDTAHIPELVIALRHAEDDVRRLAALALGKIGHTQAVEPLLALLQQESADPVRRYAIKALGDIGDARACPALEQMLANGGNIFVSREVQQALAKCSPDHIDFKNL